MSYGDMMYALATSIYFISDINIEFANILSYNLSEKYRQGIVLEGKWDTVNLTK